MQKSNVSAEYYENIKQKAEGKCISYKVLVYLPMIQILEKNES